MEQNENKTTCLHDLHLALNAKMSPFAGFDMPIEYKGIVEEHNAVREGVGVFDVSHMGEVLVEGTDAQRFVNHIFTNDVTKIADGDILYGMMLYPNGGVVDDLLVYRLAENEYFLVINAGNIAKDLAWIQDAAKGYDVQINDLSDYYGELAVQGPAAEKTISDVLGIDASDLTFYTFKDIEKDDEKMIVSRTGYTGEDGFEVYASHEATRRFWQKLMDAGVQPCGLGCRDTLRFEAGLPLYGDELTAEITPVEAGLSMFCKLDKDEFIGKDVVARQKAEGVDRKSVGLEIEGPAIARHGYDVLDEDGNVIGTVTTGYRSITLNRNLAMALVNIGKSKLGTPVSVRVRRKTFPATVVKKRFYTPNYKK
ncbi:MAG: glycine cleavage system aminomethyltransferase GcvT [Bacteroidales bacterium]|nr:glycine cleavage system aminomethyltransferase GcvT [Bacteroidales bacterium]